MDNTLKRVPSRSAFTIVELLVVVAVIGILVGFVMPLVGGMGQRALDSRAKDLCAQVAAAWNLVSIDNTRFPGKSLVEAVVDCEDLGGDLCFRMTPAAGALLNEWRAATPIPSADKSHFDPTGNEGGKKFNPRVSKTEYPDYETAVEFPTDFVLERDVGQKRFGVYAPWVERAVREETGENNFEEVLPSDVADGFFGAKGTFAHGIVTVLIDENADGLITIPKDVVGADEDVELRTKAAAWVWNEKKSKVLHSW